MHLEKEREMQITTHTARVTGPVPYLAADGKAGNIPLGPCLVEQLGDQLANIIWGDSGQVSAALALEDLKVAEAQGHLVLLD
jgi:hypothetical protein